MFSLRPDELGIRPMLSVTNGRSQLFHAIDTSRRTSADELSECVWCSQRIVELSVDGRMPPAGVEDCVALISSGQEETGELWLHPEENKRESPSRCRPPEDNDTVMSCR